MSIDRPSMSRSAINHAKSRFGNPLPLKICQSSANILHKLSAELQAAEDRAAQLEAEVRACQDRAFRSEKWLLRVYSEIEEQFFNGNRSTGGRRSQQ